MAVEMMESFLTKSLNRLKKELPRRFNDVRTKCDEMIERLAKGDFSDEFTSEEVTQFLEPFFSSMYTRVPKAMEIALEAVNFMIDHGVFRVSGKNNLIMDEVIQSVSKCSDEFDEGVQVQVIKTLLTSITSLQCEVHGASLLLAVRSCFHIHLMSKNNNVKTTAKAALTQMVNVINQRMEVNSANSVSNNDGADDSMRREADVAGEEFLKDDAADESSSSSLEGFSSIYQKDSYLLFRALCKLSMKGASESVAGSSDNILLQNKILSLELLLNLLQNAGPVFKQGEKFISAVRAYLCVSLLSNCTSQVTQITTLSLQIFVTVVQTFKSENSTFEHKIRVLEVFHDICRDPKDLIEIFINYDCDMDAANLFSNIVSAFAKLTKNPSSSSSSRLAAVEFISASGKKNQNEDLQLRVMSVEGLCLIVKSLLSSVALNKMTDESRSPDVKKDSRQDSSEDTQEAPDEAMDGDSSTPSIVDTFDKKQRFQEEIENGILKFNLHAMKGIKYLVAVGHIQLDAKSVAQFLLSYQDRLDKTMIGDFLGREREYENGFAYAVLNEYVESIDFSEMKFDKAIRFFLRGFRLPGEAQKIDRIMEKFAERYFIQHQEEFASADMAFILAFSTIMLQTNLHNPAIREDKRMTKDQFIRQNKGISSDGELSDELLSEIYDRIAAEPISITEDTKRVKKDDSSASFVVFQSATEKRKKDAFSNERLEMVRAGEALIRQNKKRGSVFVRNTISEESCVKPMFEVLWPTIIGVVSQVLENTDEAKLVEVSLQCLHNSISLACRLDHSVARKTMIHALCKFTTLDTVREMRPKHVSCIQLLLDLALSEGEFLDDNWLQLLQIISQLARLLQFSTGGADDMLQSMAQPIPAPSDSLSKLFLGPTRAEVNRQVEEGNAELIANSIDPLLVDRIFVGSKNLSAASVLHFVRSLCEVSLSEISPSTSPSSFKIKDPNEPAAPRIFSLQKLVEVADCNMNSRSRVDWAYIWKFLADHFTLVGLQDNEVLAMYAIDSLKQLSIKFLQKNELSNFNFQRIFLKPFEIIIARSSLIVIKDLVLRCIDIMIKACAGNIRSGWKSIFTILEMSANQAANDVAKLGFDILEGLMRNHFDLLTHDFVELMNTFVAFVSSHHTELSLRALPNLLMCADCLAEGNVLPWSQQSSGDFEDIKSMVGEDAAVFRLWWPLLLGLSTHVADLRVSVRCQSLETLSVVLNKYGDVFSPQTWSVIFKGVLFPMIDSAQMDADGVKLSQSSSKQSWINTMANRVLSICLELFFRFDSNSEDAPLLPSLLTMLQGCVCQENDALARMGLDALRRLFLSPPTDERQTALIVERIEKVLSRLLVFDFFDAGSLSFHSYPCTHLFRKILCMRAKHDISSISANEPSEENITVLTTYGPGTFTRFIEGGDVPPRWEVDLVWGGRLFSGEFSTLVNHSVMKLSVQNRASFLGRIVTNWAITIEFLHLLKDFIAFQRQLDTQQIKLVAYCLEVTFWHAVAFNEDISLRLHLSALMASPASAIPELVDQEVFSLTLLLKLLFAQHASLFEANHEQGKDMLDLIAPSLERLSVVTFKKFCQLEGIDCESLSAAHDDGDEDTLRELVPKKRHTAYSYVVLTLLACIFGFRDSQFRANERWIVPCLTDLVRCESAQIRDLVHKVFRKFVVPRFI